MSEGIPYADIIILALIAGFILLRLRSVLGSRSDNDPMGSGYKPLPPSDPVVQLDEKSLKPKSREETDSYLATLPAGPVADALGAIRAKDPQFSATDFLAGARGAFEMVFDAFVKGDKSTLKMLLNDAIYQQFSREIDARDGTPTRVETTLVSVSPKEIGSASLSGGVAQLGVRFESEQVTVTRDAKGAIVEGNPSDIHHVEDHWTFERDTTSKNPNWKIIET